jgi:hypothetical protein
LTIYDDRVGHEQLRNRLGVVRIERRCQRLNRRERRIGRRLKGQSPTFLV